MNVLYVCKVRNISSTCMFTYLFFTHLIVHCTHCSPVLVIVTCVFVFLFLGGLDISI